MKTIKNILNSTLIFGLCYTFEKTLFGVLYYFTPNASAHTLTEAVASSILGSITEMCSDNIYILTIFVIQSILELIMFSVFTSYVFAYILNREPRVVFPDKLLVRRRTSVGSNGITYLCIMIGNKSRTKIRNAVCTLSCSYVKDNDGSKTNSEFNTAMLQPTIDNYYRFSCKLTDLPQPLLKHYFENNDTGLEHDVIKITLSGNMNTFGNNFLVEQKYKISDIVIGENYVGPELKCSSESRIINRIIRNRIDWKKLQKIKPMEQEEKESILAEIEKICTS